MHEKTQTLLKHIAKAAAGGVRGVDLEEKTGFTEKTLRCRVRPLLAEGLVKKFVGVGMGGPSVYVLAEFADELEADLKVQREAQAAADLARRAEARNRKKREARARKPRERNSTIKPDRQAVETLFETFGQTETRSVATIAEQARLTISETRNVLRRMSADGRAVSMQVDGVWMWGKPGSKDAGRSAKLSAERVCNGNQPKAAPYTLPKMVSYRAGADDHRAIRSLGACAA